MNSPDHFLTVAEQWLSANHYGNIIKNTRLRGGCINTTSHLTTDSGHSFCLKLNSNAPDDFFTAEATGLEHLNQIGAFTTPKVVHVDQHFILLEYIAAGKSKPTFWQTLGEQLAACHLQTKPRFGFVRDNYCGLTPQINTQCKDGFEFFAQYRLLTQTKWAREKHLVNDQQCKNIEFIANKLDQWIPSQVPALLHGDLWQGNVHCDRNGDPVLIDPACYWGWPEADLAMTTLFGEFDAGFYQAYQHNRPLEPGWRERFPLYNLYHLLNHLNLFGNSYLQSVEAIIRRYR